jgi:hypothetical protein
MWMRHALVLVGLFGSASAAYAQSFTVDNVDAARKVDVAQLKPHTVAFSDGSDGVTADSEKVLLHFEDWGRDHPNEKKFLALFPDYVEPTVVRPASGSSAPTVEKLYMYVAQARFILDRPPSAVDLSHEVALPFIEKIDPSITHKDLPLADVSTFADDIGKGNENPDRKWCTGRTTLICIQSSYKFEGKIPLGIMLVNKLRDSEKKVSERIDFQSELAALSPADVDQPGLQQLTGLDAPISGVLEQNIFYVNQIMKFGKLLAIFQAHPTDPNKTVVTAFMSLAIKARVLDERRGFENMPVLRNLVPAQVLMGQSSFNSGTSLSGGLPKYARSEISTIAGILENDAAAK